MATDGMFAENSAEFKLTAEEDRELQKKLRDFGKEYISRSGRLVPAKIQPDVLCSCPQRCNEKISTEDRMKLFSEFYKLGDQIRQNEFLRAHINARAVQKRSPDNKPLKRAKRRVSCKYRVPLLSKTDMHIGPGTSPTGARLIEVCQKAFMNIFVITEKRVRLQREKLIVEVMGTKGIPHVQHKRHPHDVFTTNKLPLQSADEPVDMTIPRNTTEVDVTILKEREHDIALVDNFFMNQLWKPEYINTAI
ncbi:uncharacterized protein LOC126175481 [Schistocerca cancellata]|uniref:uncharacterized protein LOC126175481 n=1 Tax=Schistocerca cancellata TaxID=274614 RepID=UPI0021178CBD|nr:uncharacterized protein LOC126175481 [Schistocerca cancellata]